ncbi:hypothetical protein ABKN59_005668 [Abortiporus biennis]
MLNTVLLGVCISIVGVTIIYLFYWNRIIGYLVGVLFRLAFWGQGESSVWLAIDSIHFSLLNGSILFKGLRYHSSNQTIRIVKGQISWRYWIRSPAQEDDLAHAQLMSDGRGVKPKRPLSCRIHVSLQGLEWFCYNRTAAYDNIISSMESFVPHDTQEYPFDGTGPRNTAGGGGGRASLLKMFSRTSVVPQSSLFAPPASILSSLQERTPAFVKQACSWLSSQLPNLDPKELLPVSIEVSRGAITCGNASTKSLFVAEFNRASGTYGVVPSRSKYDLYKTLLNLTFQNASLHLLENEDHRNSMQNEGKLYHDEIRVRNHRQQFSYLSFPMFQKLWRQLKLYKFNPSSYHYHHHRATNLNPFSHSYNSRRSKVPEKAANDNLNGSTSGDEDQQEYAKERKILETPVLELVYYADAVGTVPTPQQEYIEINPLDPLDIGNGDLPPEWGVEIVVNGGFIRYGPWADRQRTELQQAFFPSQHTTVEPRSPLRPGDTRVWTSMKLFIELRDGVTLQIPFREASKNWQWDGKVIVPDRPRTREAASIHVKAGDSSTISYLMPMVASPLGYEPSLEVHLDTVSVTSSLNDIKLLTADSCRVHCDLPSPLRWRDERKWTFSVSLRRPSFWLLRDHINMFTDLGRDWSSGPPTDYNKFIPMVYALDLDMQGYEINTYVNDQNIIDKPLIKDENALLILRGNHFQNGVIIPLNKYRPASTEVSFWIDAPDISVSLTLPRWNTHSLYPTPHRSDIGRIGRLELDASYRYFAEVHSEHIDQLRLNFSASDVVYKACGWTIRHFMILRDNYFGSFTHFSTLNEYLQKRQSGLPVGDPIDLQYREGASNAMHVDLTLALNSGLMVIPAGLPGYEAYNLNEAYNLDEIDIGASLILAFPALQLCLRTHEYYMDMSLNADTMSGRIQDRCLEKLWSTGASEWNEKETFVIDGLDITAHRLFGAQPHTTTYVCIWEIHVGAVKAVLSAAEARILLAASTAFKLNFSDPLNSPAAEYALPADPDVTFVKIALDALNVVWNAGDASAELSLNHGLRLDSNDWPGKYHKKVTSLRVPDISAKLLLASQTAHNTWFEAVAFEADANIDIYSAPPRWREKARIQREFVEHHDVMTGRVKFLYDPGSAEENNILGSGRGLIDTDLFLPQLRVPIFRPGPGIHARRNNVEQPAAQFASPQMPGLSESEPEETIPDSVRDARLAQLRPPPHTIAVEYDNDSMSSGDESDNGDSSEYDSDSDSNASYHPAQEPSVLVANNMKLSAHYGVQYLDRPSYWNGSPYRLTKDRFVDGAHIRHEQHMRRRVGATDFAVQALEDVGEDVDATIFHFRSVRTINLYLTPLALPSCDAFLKDLTAHQLSPELRFDAIMASHIQTFASISPPKQISVFDIQLSGAHLTLAQSAVLATFDSLKDATFGKESVTRSEVITTCSLALDGLLLTGCSKSGLGSDSSLTLVSSFSSLKSGLYSADSINGERANPLSIELSGTNAFSIVGRKVVVTLDDIQTHVDHSAPNLVAAVGIASATWTAELSSTFNRFTKSTPRLDQQIIFQVLSLSRDKVIVDPLSTIQPSYLIQCGKPHQLRTDVIFRFLVYLRNCLRYLVARERLSLPDLPQDSSDSVPLDEVRTLVEDQLMQSGVDMDFPLFASKANSLLSELFMSDKKTNKSAAKGSLPVDSLHFGVQHFRLSIIHSASHTSSNLSTRCFSTDALLQSVEWQPNAKFVSPIQSPMVNGRTVRRISLYMSIGDVALSILPQILHYAQAAVRVVKFCTQSRPPSPKVLGVHSPPSPTASQLLPIYVETTFAMNSFRFKAAAETLVIEYRLSKVAYTSSILATIPSGVGASPDVSTNHTVTYSEMRLQACSAAEMSKIGEYSVLASFTITDGRLSLTGRQDRQTRRLIRLAVGISGLHLNVPRSAMRLYRFAQDWQADYLPAFNATIRALISDLKNTQRKQPSVSSGRSEQPSSSLSIQVTTSVSTFRISLQVMHGIWISYEILQSVAYLTSPSSTRKGSHEFGVQLGSQRISITSRTPEGIAADIRVKMDVPTISMTGHHDGTRIRAMALVEFFRFTVKPSHWDTLLSVQQKFGQDFNDLFTLIAETRHKNATPQTPKKTSSPLNYDVLFKLSGFSIGLEGHSSTLFLECKDIGGAVSSEKGSRWRINLTDLALSLAPQFKYISKEPTSFERRSAFVNVDFKARMEHRGPSQDEKFLDISFTKIHAVMQPSSIAELGDYVDHLQAEISTRKEKRASELAEFKEKTRNIMKTFDVKLGDTQPERASLLADYSINLNVKSIGIAFPLTFNSDLQLPNTGSRDESSVRAFLFSIKSIDFGTQRGESGQATMRGFSFQFISSFQQSSPKHFSGENHSTRNRLVYPEMTAQLRSERSSGSRRIRIKADVDGFILDIDSSIPDYVTSLIDVYRQGKERVARLTSSIPRSETPITPQSPVAAHIEADYNAILTSNILASLTFASGKVRMYSRGPREAIPRVRTVSIPSLQSSDDRSREHGAEVFNLPVVSVWGEYRATPAASKVPGRSQSTEPAVLLFKTTIHSSQNTLRPTLLPFLTELVGRIEEQLRRTSLRDPPPVTPSSASDLLSIPSAEKRIEVAKENVSSLQITLSLRIDQSKLELSCQPDVNVIAGLHWDSGGFMVNISPGARRVDFTGNVGGLTIGLKHGFLSEDCARLDAHNLIFNMTFAKVDNRKTGKSTSSVSVVLDTEFSGGVRFSRLQDVLCFKAVWLDRIPVLNGRVATPVATSPIAKNPINKSNSSQELVTAVLLRFRKIKLTVDLGQSISSVVLDLDDALVRTKVTERASEVSLSVSNLSVAATGNISGHAEVPNFRFQTIHRNKPSVKQGSVPDRMLDLTMTSGPLDIELDSEFHKLAYYRAEPLEVTIYDDWSQLTTKIAEEDRSVRLTFTVTGSEVVAAISVSTIPKLVSYAAKFKANLEAQREGAARESKAFRMANAPKPDTPLSAFANAMLSSARTRIKEADHGLMHAIVQRMSLKLKILRLVVFPRSMRDTELAQFIGTDVHARLDRRVESETLPPKRDLQLSFSSMTISKISNLGHSLAESVKEKGGNNKEWLVALVKGASEATIFGLPSMNMWMKSDETFEGDSRIIAYDFSSTFVAKATEGAKDAEDIYITLNMSLYSWLTVLRKTFTREMDQIHTPITAVTSMTSLQSSGSMALASQRKKTTGDSIGKKGTLPLVPESSKSSISGSSTLVPTSGHSKSRSITIFHPQSTTSIDDDSSLLPTSPTSPALPSSLVAASIEPPSSEETAKTPAAKKTSGGVIYQPRTRLIERLTMRQLGEATPDVRHPFFMKKAGFSLEDSLPQYVHEYATMPTEEIMKILLKLYSRQLKVDSSIVDESTLQE